LNPAHIFPKKEKEPETRTIRRTILMSQSDDDEEEKIALLKRHNKHEDSTMKGNVNLQ
jgi:hypothetical protein